MFYKLDIPFNTQEGHQGHVASLIQVM